MQNRIMVLLGVLLLTASLSAQELPLLWGQTWAPDARGLAMGGAMTAVPGSPSAMFYNPAALAAGKTLDFQGALSHLAVDQAADYWGAPGSESLQSMKLGNMGLSVPIPTLRGSMVFGMGYYRCRDFDRSLSGIAGDTLDTQLYEQVDGGLSRFVLSGAMEVAPRTFVGASINFWGGKNNFMNRYSESDEAYNVWNFSSFDSLTTIETEYSGVNLTFSAFYQLEDKLNFGLILETPLTLTGSEVWAEQDDTIWDDGELEAYGDEGSFKYKIKMPMKLRGGVAVNLGPLLLAADITLMDYSQIRFQTDTPDGYSEAEANINIRQFLTSATDYSLGGELTVPGTALRLRGGYQKKASPYKEDDALLSRQVFSAGVGFMLTPSMSVDVAFARTEWDLPGGQGVTAERIETQNLLFGVTYRLK